MSLESELHIYSQQVYSVTKQGCGKDIIKDFDDIFSGIGKLTDFQMKLYIKEDVRPVAQPVRRLPFCL